jgi:hypothetical protein
MRHVSYQFQVSGSVRVDHHGAFDGNVPNAEREGGVASVET